MQCSGLIFKMDAIVLNIFFLATLLTAAVTADPITDEMISTLNEMNNEDLREMKDEINPKFFGFFESTPPKKVPGHQTVPHHEPSTLDTIHEIIHNPVEVLKEKLEEKKEFIKDIIKKPIEIIKEKFQDKKESLEAVVSSVKDIVNHPIEHLPPLPVQHEELPHLSHEEPHVNHAENHHSHHEEHEHHLETVQQPILQEATPLQIVSEHEEHPYINNKHEEEYLAPIYEIYETPAEYEIKDKEPLVNKIEDPVKKIVAAASQALHDLKSEIIQNKVQAIVNEIKEDLKPHNIEHVIHDIKQPIIEKIEEVKQKPLEVVKKPVTTLLDKLVTIKDKLTQDGGHEHEDGSHFTSFDLMTNSNDIIKPVYDNEIDEEVNHNVYYYNYPPSYGYNYPYYNSYNKAYYTPNSYYYPYYRSSSYYKYPYRRYYY